MVPKDEFALDTKPQVTKPRPMTGKKRKSVKPSAKNSDDEDAPTGKKIKKPAEVKFPTKVYITIRSARNC